MKIQTHILYLVTLSSALLACSADGDSDLVDPTGTGGALGSGGETAVTGGMNPGVSTGGVDASGSGGAASGGGEASGGLTASGGSDPATGGTAASDCTPDASATAVAEGELVYDARYCLRWQKVDTGSGSYGYVDAVAYCEALSLGGYDDWRIPTAAEAKTVFDCDGTWPHVSPPYETSGDGFWTSTESGTLAGDLPKVCGAGQNSGTYYDFGQVGAQPTRCVSGPNTLPDVSCKSGPICQ